MMTSVRKQLWSVVRWIVPVVGFTLTCVGAYLVSLQMNFLLTWSVSLAYFLIILGFLVILAGVFWTLCTSMTSKVYQRRRQQPRVQIFTTETSVPPSYEESQNSHWGPGPEFLVSVDGLEMVLVLAPPLYDQDGLQEPDCSWSWERPPRYSQVQRETRELLP